MRWNIERIFRCFPVQLAEFSHFQYNWAAQPAAEYPKFRVLNYRLRFDSEFGVTSGAQMPSQPASQKK